MIAETADERWPITAEQRQQAVDIVLGIATESKDAREQLAAVRCLLSMEAQNIKFEQQQDSQLRTAIHKLARERGIVFN